MKTILCVLYFFFLTSFCTNAQNQIDIKENWISWGYKKFQGERKIDVVIIHSTYNKGADSFSVEGILNQFKQYGVSAHYLIKRNGEIIQLVSENNIAYHAGAGSLPDGRKSINSNSIGIEIITSPNHSITKEQYASLVLLVKKIQKKHALKYIKGHNDIAPDRKTDPWNFDWNLFTSILENK